VFLQQGKSEPTNSNLRTEIMGFIAECCHFLETLYDPYFTWRNFVGYKKGLRIQGNLIRCKINFKLIMNEFSLLMQKAHEL